MVFDARADAWAPLFAMAGALFAGASAAAFARSALASRGGARKPARGLVTAGLLSASASVGFLALFAIVAARAGLPASRQLAASAAAFALGCAGAAFPRALGLPLLALAAIGLSALAAEAGSWTPFEAGRELCLVTPLPGAGSGRGFSVREPGRDARSLSLASAPSSMTLSVDYLEFPGAPSLLFGARRFRLASLAFAGADAAFAFPADPGPLERAGAFRGLAGEALRAVTGAGTRSVFSAPEAPLEFVTYRYTAGADGSLSVSASAR